MELIFITNDPVRARICDNAGIDFVMVDLEINGKDERQGHLNTVISRHQMTDVAIIRSRLKQSRLLVRVNPIYDASQSEIDAVIEAGADRIMLPMFRTPDEVSQFVKMVDGRAETCLLLETPSALTRINQIVSISGVDIVHIGLNDLHLSLGLDFMFEPLAGGLMDFCAQACVSQAMAFGFGGIARLGTGTLPAELILSEHMRLGSEQVILSRDFVAVFDESASDDSAEVAISNEVQKVRAFLSDPANQLKDAQLAAQTSLRNSVIEIVSTIQARR